MDAIENLYNKKQKKRAQMRPVSISSFQLNKFQVILYACLKSWILRIVRTTPSLR